MLLKRDSFLGKYYQIVVAFVITACLIRVYEYFAIARKFFITHPIQFEIAGLLYDVWACLIYSTAFLLPYFLLSLSSKKLANIIFHVLNVLLIVMYLALIVVFSERNTPFDHEFFTRSLHESWLTTKQMMTSGVLLYLPFAAYIGIYFLLYNKLFRKKQFKQKTIIVFVLFSFLSTLFIKFCSPKQSWFKQTAAYYLTCNKFNFWITDSYQYFSTKDKYNADKLSSEQISEAIDFYQKNQPFEFTGKEYPLMHKSGIDVLGGFFNLNKTTPPNIVILVVEGLSRDFSGDKAYATSFTPFLDSLSKKSLVWDNFLSTAPGTFAAHPAISGSLPYGSRGFSAINVMPDHLSLIKILKRNGYNTKFLIGFNPDFDNMGGYIRLQGTDFVLSKYGAKYKEMGVGSEGWSMGYPDDALFSRSFEVMDSLPQTPYLNIYHTATTHMPYLFAQKPQYDKLFDKKLKTLTVSSTIRKTLKECKRVLVTYMFADDCIKKFFAEYAKRHDYQNTIFFITGDHHIGSFPSTGAIDDYHVPLIVYSPMLKAARKFYSVNSHNNLAPTITDLVLDNYNVPYHPKDVHWLGGDMDTCTSFRNIQSMPFMEWSREISDYIYKDYFVSGNQLYKLTPELLQEPIENDSLKKHIIELRDNFKIINSYVCNNNKIYPAQQTLLPGERKLLFDYTDNNDKTYFSNKPDTAIMPDFKVPEEYKYLYVETSASVNLPAKEIDLHPTFRLALIDKNATSKNYLYWSKRDIASLTKGDYIPQQWNAVSTNDMFTLDDYKKNKNLFFELAIYTDAIPINLKMKQLNVKIYGVK
jgi:uncharacterized sulfatase